MDVRFGKGPAVGVAIAVALLIFNAWLTFRNTRQLDGDARLVAHTHEALDVLASVRSSVQRAKTAQRTFLFTEDRRQLDVLDDAAREADDHITAVGQLTVDNPRQQDRIPRLRAAAASRLDRMKEVIRVRQDQGPDAARRLLQGEGEEKTETALRTVLGEMEAEERDLLREREGATRRAYLTAVGAGLLADLLGLAAVLACVWLVRRSLRSRLRAAAVIQREQERFRVTLASIGDAVIVTDDAGRVTFLNAAARALTGWGQDALGKELPEVFRIENEQTGEAVESPVAKVLQAGSVVGLGNHTILVGKDGTRRPIDDSGAPIRDGTGRVSGVVLVFRDVTQRRQLERLQRDLQGQLEEQVRQRTEDLRQSEERFRLLVEGTTDYAIFMLDPEGRVSSWNPGAERINGYKAEEIIGQHFSRFYPPEDLAAGKPARELEIARATGKYEEEGWRVRKDGSRFWSSVLITALWDEKGVLRGFGKVTRDMTQRKEAEEAARRLAEERAAREAAEAGARVIRQQREQLRVTLASIGDAVIATDAEGRVTLLNPVAQALTGWGAEEAAGQPLEAIFDIKNEVTGRPAENPVARVLREGAVVGLANHTILTARDGTVRPIDDSAAPIKDEAGRTLGVVLVFHDVTQKRRAERLLRESEERYRLIVETAQEGIWLVDPEGHTRFANARMAQMLGCTPDELRSRPVWDFLDADVRRQAEARLRQREQGTAEQFEARFRRKDGSALWALVSAGPVHDAEGQFRGALGLVTDITERRRVEQAARFLADASAALAALEDYESTLRKVARLAVPFFADWCAVDTAGPDGALRRVAVTHVDPSKVQLAYELRRRHPPDPDAPQGAWHVLRSGQPELVPEITDALLVQSVKDPDQLRALRELGLRSYIGVPIPVRDQVLGVLTFVAAESGRVYGPADLAVAQDLGRRVGIAIENARLYAEVKEADRKKDEFLAMLAHELRNPLAPISNALQILRMTGMNGPTAERARAMMDRQVQHMVRLVDDLLDVSRIMQGKIELRKEPVEVAAVVARAVETARPAIDAQRHELTITLPPEPVLVEADPVRLAQVVSNLLNNSAKYMEAGGHIWLSAERRAGHLVLRVRDAGIGIAPDLLARIFDLFVQAEHGVGRAQGGLGIGLTLVKRLVELHGGSVTAHSDGPGKGSEFVIVLPALPPTRPAAPPAAEPAEAPSAAPPPALRVLVVDDNVDAAESLATLLRLEGQDVRVAHDGPAALEAAPAYRPDVVFLDIGMPGMDGYEVARRLRREPGLEGVLLVALTGWGQDEDRRRSREAGFDEHLVKPVDPAAVATLLHAGQARGA